MDTYILLGNKILSGLKKELQNLIADSMEFRYVSLPTYVHTYMYVQYI